MNDEEKQRLYRLLQLDALLHKAEQTEPEKRADALRGLTFELSFTAPRTKDGNASSVYSNPVARRFQKQYEKIVDCRDESTGLNNFASGALALCNKNRNESDKWVSSFTTESLLSMNCVKDLVDKCKAESQQLLPNPDTTPLWPEKEGGAVHKRKPLFKRSADQSDLSLPKPSSHAEQLSTGREAVFPGKTRGQGAWQSTFSHTSAGPSSRPSSTLQSTFSDTSAGPSSRPSSTLQSTFSDASAGPSSRPSSAFQSAFSHTSAGPSSGPSSTFKSAFSHTSAGPSSGPSSTFKSAFSHTSTGPSSRHSSAFQSAFSDTSAGPLSRPSSAFSSVGKTGNRSWAEKRGRDGNDVDEEDAMDAEPSRPDPRNSFKTAREQLVIDQNKKYRGQDRGQSTYSYGASKKSLGTRRGPNNKFIPPVLNRDSDSDAGSSYVPPGGRGGAGPSKSEEPVDERLKGIEPKIVELITNEIMDHKPQMDWDDIAGLQFAKKTIKEIVVWPMLRPDIFTGLRGPPKGLLLFGPPGTGKTLIGKCIASQSKSTFFCISASSLTSKWVGEGEKMVRGLFAVARCHQPAVIFIDEVDSLLSQRSDGEHEASRRIKTEFLVQLDGATTGSEDRILVIGATNRPQEIDEAARRRFVKRLYIPLPELIAREHIVKHLMSQQNCRLSDADIETVGQRTEGYSGADMANLCREAALGPIRSIPFEQMEYIRPEQVPPITIKDFEAALPQVRPSVSAKDLDVYITWNSTYGSFGQ